MGPYLQRGADECSDVRLPGYRTHDAFDKRHCSSRGVSSRETTSFTRS